MINRIQYQLWDAIEPGTQVEFLNPAKLNEDEYEIEEAFLFRDEGIFIMGTVIQSNNPLAPFTKGELISSKEIRISAEYRWKKKSGKFQKEKCEITIPKNIIINLIEDKPSGAAQQCHQQTTAMN